MAACLKKRSQISEERLQESPMNCSEELPKRSSGEKLPAKPLKEDLPKATLELELPKNPSNAKTSQKSPQGKKKKGSHQDRPLMSPSQKKLQKGAQREVRNIPETKGAERGTLIPSRSDRSQRGTAPGDSTLVYTWDPTPLDDPQFHPSQAHKDDDYIRFMSTAHDKLSKIINLDDLQKSPAYAGLICAACDTPTQPTVCGKADSSLYPVYPEVLTGKMVCYLRPQYTTLDFSGDETYANFIFHLVPATQTVPGAKVSCNIYTLTFKGAHALALNVLDCEKTKDGYSDVGLYFIDQNKLTQANSTVPAAVVQCTATYSSPYRTLSASYKSTTLFFYMKENSEGRREVRATDDPSKRKAQFKLQEFDSMPG